MVKRKELISYTLYISKNKIPYEIAEYIITFYYTWVFETKEELQKAIKAIEECYISKMLEFEREMVASFMKKKIYIYMTFDSKGNIVKEKKAVIKQKNFNYGEPNYWDVSKINDMSGLFFNIRCNINISNWDVSNVKNMTQMFWRSEIDCDISDWDVSNVKEMDNIFLYSLIQIPKWYAYNTH